MKVFKQTPEERLMRKFQSQTAIADVVGCSRQCVNLWFKRGGLSHKGAVILSRYTGFSVDSLLVRWTPKSNRVHTVQDARKKMRAERSNKSRAKRGA